MARMRVKMQRKLMKKRLQEGVDEDIKAVDRVVCLLIHSGCILK